MKLIGIFFLHMTSFSMTSYIEAKNISELETAIRRSSEMRLDHQRCLKEIEGKLTPAHCFKWIVSAAIPLKRKSFLHESFENSCIQGIRSGGEKLSYGISFLPDLGPRCRQALLAWSKIWMYKMSQEQNRGIRGKHKVGRKLEMIFEYEDHNSGQQDRVFHTKAHWRRSN